VASITMLATAALSSCDNRCKFSLYGGKRPKPYVTMLHAPSVSVPLLQACTDSILDALAKAGTGGSPAAPRVRGIGVSGQQHGLVALDGDCQVIRPGERLGMPSFFGPGSCSLAYADRASHMQTKRHVGADTR
jgi:sugar (pentulose or hexulose) kinase